MKKATPYAYVCLWEYVPENKHKEPDWKLVECYGVDDSGYVVTESKYAVNDRCSHIAWMNEKEYYNPKTKEFSKNKVEGFEDYDWNPIMGRAVTTWDFVSGCSLEDLHPPEWTKWLNSLFTNKLTKIPNWYELIAGGSTLFLGTARAVKEMMFDEKK